MPNWARTRGWHWSVFLESRPPPRSRQRWPPPATLTNPPWPTRSVSAASRHLASPTCGSCRPKRHRSNPSIAECRGSRPDSCYGVGAWAGQRIAVTHCRQPDFQPPSGFRWVYPRGTTTGQLPAIFQPRPVSAGFIPGGPQLASYRQFSNPVRFPLGLSQGDHNWPATGDFPTPSGFRWVYPRGTTTGQLPAIFQPRPVSAGFIPEGPQLASYRQFSNPVRFPLGLSQGDHNWPATGNFPTPSGFRWVYPRGTTTGQLPAIFQPRPVSAGFIPEGPQLASYRQFSNPVRFPLGLSGGPQLVSYRRFSNPVRFPLGLSQGDHNWSATVHLVILPVAERECHHHTGGMSRPPQTACCIWPCANAHGHPRMCFGLDNVPV